jgi:hypothetical protein
MPSATIRTGTPPRWNARPARSVRSEPPMTLEQIAYIAQIAGVLVVAATLIFLALQ